MCKRELFALNDGLVECAVVKTTKVNEHSQKSFLKNSSIENPDENERSVPDTQDNSFFRF